MQQFITRTESKPLYAYADTFSHPSDNGNKDYYIASIFTHVHMQENGELNLAGMYREQFFLKGSCAPLACCHSPTVQWPLPNAAHT